MLEGSGSRALVTHVLRECIRNAPAFSLFLPAFDDTGFLGSPQHRLAASCFLAGNREAELKPTTCFSLLLFLFFLFF